MKKLVLSLAIIGFVAFGALGVQNLIAASAQSEIVNFDKDPKKDDNKKATEAKASDSKDVNADAKTSGSCEKSCATSCSDKSASSSSCCGSDKAASASTTPDKK